MKATPLRLLSAGLVSFSLLAACGSDDESGSDSDSTEAVDETADGTTDDTTDGTDVTESALPVETDNGNGSDSGDFDGTGCHVTVTGDVTKEWTAADESANIAYGPWAAEALGDESVMSISLDAGFFIINCASGDDTVSFTAANGFQVPMEPATYTIKPTDITDNGQFLANDISMFTTLSGTDTNFGLESDGTLTITEFDSDHIAGTFELPVVDTLFELSGAPSKGSAVLRGEFDFTNPN